MSATQIRTDSMKERRRYGRVSADRPDIIGKMLSASEVRLIDMSVGGISLKADKRLEINREYSLQLEHGGKALWLRGTVVWSVLAGRSKGPHGTLIYKAGMRLNHGSSLKLDEVIHLIRRDDPDDNRGSDEFCGSGAQRLNIGVCTKPCQEAILSPPAGYRLRKISFSRMIVESESELESGTVLPFEISLAEDSFLSFWGRVAFGFKSGAYGGADCYTASIEFMDMPAKSRNKLEEFIQLVERKDNTSSFFVTVRPADIL